jgi:uncharacterized membrane protein YedE/YeeE
MISAAIIGLLFGSGIAISGMANPAKVLNFFDIAGNWDPSLAVVMAAALTVAFVGYRVVLRRPAPILEPKFLIPEQRRIDAPLVVGSAIFGVGWGITGLCPGGAIPALGLGQPTAFLFVGAMGAGMLITRWIRATLQSRFAEAETPLRA